MGKRLTLFTIIFMLIFTAWTAWYSRPVWISSLNLSPQHTLIPQALETSIDPSPPLARFNNKPVIAPSLTFADSQATKTPVLGQTTSPKHIEVDLTNQRLYAFEGPNKVYDFLISSGKWGRTPTGRFSIWIKLRATK